MDAIPVSSSVFFWNAEGQIVYGTVQSKAEQSGILILRIKTDDGKDFALPASGVTHLSEDKPEPQLLASL